MQSRCIQGLVSGRRQLTGAGQPLSVGAEFNRRHCLRVSGQRELHCVVWFGRVGLEMHHNRSKLQKQTISCSDLQKVENPRGSKPQNPTRLQLFSDNIHYQSKVWTFFLISLFPNFLLRSLTLRTSIYRTFQNMRTSYFEIKADHFTVNNSPISPRVFIRGFYNFSGNMQNQ